ncbi:unnamed protein product [Musa hybrid cultivar]
MVLRAHVDENCSTILSCSEDDSICCWDSLTKMCLL